MLKIQVWIRNTHEYTHATIPGPTKKQTKEKFEEAFIEGDDCYCIGDVYETLPYFDLDGKSNSIDVYLGGDDNIKNKEKPVFVTSNWSDFEFEKGGGCNYEPQSPDETGTVNVWWSHDMKFNNVYFWTTVNEFDPDKLKVQYGVDQNGEKYLENFTYDGEYPDDYNDFGDCGGGYDSHNKKILLLSDLHNNIEKFNKIIRHESADINICLGDWFDSFYLDNSDDYKKTADYLMRYLSAPNNYTLFGNHDLHYLFNNHYTMCSGYEDRKYFAIDEILGSERQNIANKFKWRVWVDNYLCTHAGLYPDYIDPSVKNNDDLNLFFVKEIERANIAIRTDQNHWFYYAGRSRGGPKKGGGIVWLDFKQEFQPIEGLKQIVGHTYHKNGKVNPHHLDGSINPADCDNLCIDNGLNEYIVVSNGKLEIKKFLDI